MIWKTNPEMQKKTDRIAKHSLNMGQIAALCVGVGTTVVALLFPPYIVCGGFFCGGENAYFQTTKRQFIAEGADEPVHLDRLQYGCELFLVLWVTTITMMLLRRSVTRKSILHGLVVGEIGIITIGVARFCLDCWTSRPLLGSLAAMLRLVLFGSLWLGFWYTCGSAVSFLLLLAVGTVRLKRLKSGFLELEG